MSRHQRRRELLHAERNACHLIFDRLWIDAGNPQEVRRIAYRWLAHQLNIPYQFCHFGRFKSGMLQRAKRICRHASRNDVLGWWQHKLCNRLIVARLHPAERISKTSKTYYESRFS